MREKPCPRCNKGVFIGKKTGNVFCENCKYSEEYEEIGWPTRNKDECSNPMFQEHHDIVRYHSVCNSKCSDNNKDNNCPGFVPIPKSKWRFWR